MLDLDNKLVLIVDDTPTNIGGHRRVLKRTAYRTKVATNGEKALAIATAGEQAGPDPARRDDAGHGRLRSLPAAQGQSRRRATIPVIFLTGKTEAEDEDNGISASAPSTTSTSRSPRRLCGAGEDPARASAGAPRGRARRERADDLLEAVLPKPAADEIRTMGTVIPRRYENVAVLFCDVANFTALLRPARAEDVVSRLHALFVSFEELAAKHGLEKIKTIGDAFMAAAGPPYTKVDDPIGTAVRCGLEMARR